MRRAWSAAALVLCALATGCGGGAGGAQELDDTLGYFPDNAGLIVVVNTDLESEQLERLDRKIVRPESGGESIEHWLQDLSRGLGLSWEDDVQPLLGNPLVLGTQSSIQLTGISAAIRVQDEGKLHDLAEKIPGSTREGEASGAELYEAEGGIEFAIEDAFLLGLRDDLAVFSRSGLVDFLRRDHHRLLAVDPHRAGLGRRDRFAPCERENEREQ